jgi:hypothetical protein
VSGIRNLPYRVVNLIESGVVADFATVSSAGVPIDTPTYYFPSDDLKTIDVATGLPQPAKAERARRNPKVGLLIDGKADEPVVVVCGHAAVRDADLEANAIRYLSETGFKVISFGLGWEEARKAVHYWSRIIIENSPVRIMWWDSQSAMDGPPHVWDAPSGTVYPASDPEPLGRMEPSRWLPRPWQEVAREAASSIWRPSLTVLDDRGYPLPIRPRALEFVRDGFRLAVSGGVPWRCTGRGTITFAGIQTFVGEATGNNDAIFFKIERALPQLPSTKDSREVLQPSGETLRNKMARLEYEAKRRRQSLPSIPLDEPPPTRLAKLRQTRIAADAPITGMVEAMRDRKT